MLIDKINELVDNKEEWFFDLLTEMTENGDYGDNLSGDYPDDVDFDGYEFYISKETWSRCGSDYYSATIPLEHVVRKLRKEKLDLIKNI